LTWGYLKEYDFGLLNVELVLSNWNAVDELQGGPEPVELGALVDVDHPVGRRLAVPDGVVQVALNPVENDLEDGEAATKPFAG